MRMLMLVSIPHEPFNTLVRNGSAGKIMKKILEDIRPESAYFTELNGTRGAILAVDVPEPSAIPSLSEPFFLHFNADCEFRVAMTPEDLEKAGLEDLGAKWAG